MAEKALTIGDHVRLKSPAANQHHSFREIGPQGAPFPENVDGLVLSIRELATGKLVQEATAGHDQYVIEIVFDNTFNPRLASLRNAPRGTERATATAAWRKMRSMLKDAAGKGQLFTSAVDSSFTDSPMARMLDGWKVIKVWSCEQLVSLENAVEATPAA